MTQEEGPWLEEVPSQTQNTKHEAIEQEAIDSNDIYETETPIKKEMSEEPALSIKSEDDEDTLIKTEDESESCIKKEEDDDATLFDEMVDENEDEDEAEEKTEALSENELDLRERNISPEEQRMEYAEIAEAKLVKSNEIRLACERGNRNQLRLLARSEYGLVSDGIRQVACKVVFALLFSSLKKAMLQGYC